MTLVDLGKALEALGRQLQEAQPAADLADYVDVDALDLGAAARRAVRAGELRAFRVGRKLLVARAEFRRWVEAHPAGPAPAAAPEPDDVDQVIEMNRRRRRA